jgi:hypothetical protein
MKTTYEYKNPLKLRIPIPLRPTRIKGNKKGRGSYTRIKRDWAESE